MNEEIILNYTGDDEVIAASEFKADLQNSTEDCWILKTGLTKLDDLLGGFRGGEVSVVSGITGEGKTLLCQSFTENFYKQDEKSVWFTYEVRPRLFLEQFGDNPPEFYMPKVLKAKTINWIATRVHEAKVKFGVKAVFVDHLHYLLDMSKVYNVSLQIGDLMRGMVNIAHDFDVAFFLIAHMGKVGIDREPSKGDARDSSFVEQEADNVFYIWRSQKYNECSTLKIAKNRRNGVFNEKILLRKEGNYLKEINTMSSAREVVRCHT